MPVQSSAIQTAPDRTTQSSTSFTTADPSVSLLGVQSYCPPIADSLESDDLSTNNFNLPN